MKYHFITTLLMLDYISMKYHSPIRRVKKSILFAIWSLYTRNNRVKKLKIVNGVPLIFFYQQPLIPFENQNFVQ